AADAPSFQADALSFTYEHSATAALQDVTLSIPRGAFCAVIGPNGSGKSTLLGLLLGVARPSAGRALFDGALSAAWDRAAIARAIGVVTQWEDLVFPLTVRELVAMGRYPHLGAWRQEGAADRNAIDEALSFCGLAD